MYATILNNEKTERKTEPDMNENKTKTMTKLVYYLKDFLSVQLPGVLIKMKYWTI